MCHQISSERLGTRESFNGEFVIRPTPASGARPIFGPYRIDAGRTTIMRSVSGFVQEEAPHIKQSELCATCHTLITQALGPKGEVIGSLPEQMNYQEWLHSDFNREQRSCQSCHMPAAPGPVRASSVLGDARDTLARHVFVGGNAYMVRLLNRYRTELGVTALPSELEATAQRHHPAAAAGHGDALAVQSDAQRGHARVRRGRPEPHWPQAADRLSVAPRVAARDGQERARRRRSSNRGHSPVPERSPATTATRIPCVFEPHYEEITRPDQVQIYEPILGDVRGAPTTGLLTATQYLKDNRLLPRGFDKATAAAEIGVYGGARGIVTSPVAATASVTA